MNILDYLSKGYKILIDNNDGDFIINIIDSDFRVVEFYLEENPSEKVLIDTINLLVNGKQQKLF